MAILANAQELGHAFGARPLFSGLSFAIEEGERVGLIGPNGAGKSTLLKILAGKIAPDRGEISSKRGLSVAFLEQDPQFSPDATVFTSILEGSPSPWEWESQAQAHELISKFDLGKFGEEAKLSSLSGGWKKRVALARELLRNPDLLLLDEPTNHLDIESILWLENLVRSSRFATITITHDRVFLQSVSNRIIELDPRHAGGLLSVRGSYADYLEARSQLISAQERREVILKNTLRRETEWLRRGAKARTTKQQARIDRHGELSQEVEELTVRNRTGSAGLDFQSSDRNPKRLLEAKGLSKSYDGRTIFSGLDLLITPKTRIGLLGRNGCGKSTLIRTLLGQEEPTSGMVLRSDQLSVAYFDQTRAALDPAVTLAKTLCPLGEYVDYRGSKVHIRSYLDRFLFTSGQMDMQVGKLSGGEQSRLLLARLMLTPANLLILDEPTNDLDMATLSVLEECLTDFGGAVILVTHDRYFLDQVSTKILAFSPIEGESALTSFADLSQWEDWHKTKLQSPSKKAGSSAQEPGAAKKKRKLGFNEQRELDSMESNIQKAETTLFRLTQESELPANATNSVKLRELTDQMSKAQSEIDRLYSRWSELTKE